MEIDVFKKQDIFMNKMIEDYINGMFDNHAVFVPFFNWKMGGSYKSINRNEAVSMLKEVEILLEHYYNKYPNAYKCMPCYINDDPWQSYHGFGNDMYIVSYLEAIESEMIRIFPIL